MDGTNWLACTRFIEETDAPARIYPLANMRIVKDLVPDLSHVFAQYEMIEPWLQAKTPAPDRERLQAPEDRERLDGYYECILCFCRSEEHTSELQSLMRISYAVFCLKKKKIHLNRH